MIDEAERVVVGKRHVLDLLFAAVLARGHVLLEDYPGVAKTLMVNTLSRVLALPFKRIQFTPDLLPADITGSVIFDMDSRRFTVRRGPIFANVLLADEINRAPPKTQSALLEAMQEGQTTLEGETHELPRPFLVFATQNPIEIEGTYPLPEAQLDRFILRTAVGYPDLETEVEILRRREQSGRDGPTVRNVISPDQLETLQRLSDAVRLDREVKAYAVRLTHATRTDERLVLGASPRGSIALYELAKATALMAGRPYATAADVKRVAVPALAHRLVLTPEARARGLEADKVIEEALGQVPVPPVPMARTGRGGAGRSRGGEG